MSVLELRSVSKVYGKGAAEVQALRDTSLSVPAGTMVAVMGPSGSGTVTAFLASIAWAHSSLTAAFGNVPWSDIGLLVIGTPLVAAAAGWLLGGRAPAAVARQPLEWPDRLNRHARKSAHRGPRDGIVSDRGGRAGFQRRGGRRDRQGGDTGRRLDLVVIP
jgi:hypothetical protein